MKWASILLIASMAMAKPAEDKSGKAFSLFSVVQFANLQCTAATMTDMVGVCHTSEECDAKGGVVSGNCASGFGVCCVVTVDLAITGGTAAISNNLTYIQSANFPTTFSATGTVAAATYMFPIATTSDIGHIRLDFQTGNFEAPDVADGDCTDHDTITFTTTAVGTVGFNQLCGHLTGSHIYIQTGGTTSGNQLNIQTTTNLFARSWKILVSLIEMDNPSRPVPAGCLQYFIGASGRIQSFNFVDSAGAAATLLRFLNYRACIRPEAGAKCVTYSESGGTVASFNLEGGAGIAKMGQANCDQEYVKINGIRHCGEVLNTVEDQTAPKPISSSRFEIEVRTAGDTRRAASSGYDLTFSQSEAC